MSTEIQNAIDTFNSITAQVRAQRAADNPQALADVGAAIRDVNTANAAAAQPTNVPATQAATVQVAVDEKRAELRAVADAMKALADDNAAMRTKFEDATRKLRDFEARADKFRFPVGGEARGEFDREIHQRVMETKTDDPRVLEMQQLHDALVIMGAIQERAADKFRALGDPDRFPFKSADGNKRMTSLGQFRTKQKYDAMVRAMYSTGAAVGDEFVPTMVSSQVYEYYQMERMLAAHFQRVNMPSNPWVIPAAISDPTFYIGGEPTSDPGASAAASNLGTGSSTLTAKNLIALIRMSTDLTEDSIVAVVPLIQKALGRAWATTEEDAMINGDTTATHQDTGLTLAANSHLRVWDGLRDAVQAGAKTSLSTYTDANFAAALAKMGVHGMSNGARKPLFISSVRTFLKYISESANYWDAYKLMSMTTITNMQGVSGAYKNGLVVVSDKLRDDLNASGVYDGTTTTKGAIVMVNPNAWIIGERKGMTIRMADDIESDQMVMVAKIRETFKKLEASTTLSEGLCYEIA